ncbi:lantibiotic dehydratase [Saccharothrix variisporea]|uniref:Lantibiotic biosynthesis dehydratase-like protein n=1 Tax=Saccharothrix variisporea TaxID=543527 RepID=A0A495X2J4_9PSEU|nr:lantibiotic dehydratase [Saccharothrix variisporea]RKT66863.1 lantibiotic biosynthesis dehydratase-like protein [Saccharothrix variisporea]
MQPNASPSGPADYEVNAVVGVRVGGAPVADLDALRCPRTEAALDDAVARARWLREEGKALSDLLHPVIGRCADDDRPLLVALRRAVFRGRRPTARVWSVRPAHLAARLERWAAAAARDPVAEVARALAEDRAAAVAALRVAARRDAFRLALATASPDLTRSVSAWLDDPAAPEPGPGALASLAKYLARAVVKPSPYASFTLSGLGRWCQGGPAVVPAVPPTVARSVAPAAVPTVAPAVPTVARSAAPAAVPAVARSAARSVAPVAVPAVPPSVAPAVVPSVAPSVARSAVPAVAPSVVSSGELDWVGVAEVDRAAVLALWSALAASAPLRDHVGLRVNPSVERDGDRLWFLGAARGQPIVSVAATKAVLDLLDFVHTTAEPTVGSLVCHLAGDRAAVDELVALGLLEPLRPFPDQSADPLDHLARWVESHAPGSPWPTRLRALQIAVAGYPTLTTGRIERLRLVRDLLDGLLTDLGRDRWPARRPLLLENAVLPQPVVVCARDRWQPVLDDLEAIRGILGALDRSLPFKLHLAAFFRDRFGPRAHVSFLHLYREFRAHPSPPDRPSDLRRATLAGLYGTNDDDIVSVDPQVLAKLAASWPAHVVAPHSVCCYGQELPGPALPRPALPGPALLGTGPFGPDGPRFVLNTVRTGYGWGVTRTEHLLRTAGVTVPTRTPATAGPDVLLAECRAAFGSQLNQRAPAVPHALDHPGGQPPDHPSGQPPDHPDGQPPDGSALSPADLWVRHDPARGRLVLCDREGRQVRPLALGMLVADLLPPALRFLVTVFGEPQTAFTLPDDVGWRPPVDGVARRPRLEVGRVVLGRAGWRVAAADLPARRTSDAESLLALALWRDRHGLPERCFARVTGRRGRDRKPVYLDFTSSFGLSALPREGEVVFEEALPDPADAPQHGPHGQRVTEYVFELSERPPDSHG